MGIAYRIEPFTFPEPDWGLTGTIELADVETPYEVEDDSAFEDWTLVVDTPFARTVLVPGNSSVRYEDNQGSNLVASELLDFPDSTATGDKLEFRSPGLILSFNGPIRFEAVSIIDLQNFSTGASIEAAGTPFAAVPEVDSFVLLCMLVLLVSVWKCCPRKGS